MLRALLLCQMHTTSFFILHINHFFDSITDWAILSNQQAVNSHMVNTRLVQENTKSSKLNIRIKHLVTYFHCHSCSITDWTTTIYQSVHPIKVFLQKYNFTPKELTTNMKTSRWGGGGTQIYIG